MRISDWSSDVCSSDLTSREMIAVEQRLERAADRLAERGGHGLPAAAVRGVAATGSDSLVLGTQQEAALAHITSRNDLSIVVGYAGTGKSAMLRSEEHTSELQSLMRNTYAVFCLKNK